MNREFAMTEQHRAVLRANRVFVLDTNVLIHDPNAIFAFHGVVVCIPFMVLEELDTLKREAGEKGHNARQSIRLFDEMRRKGHLGEGVALDHDTEGAVLRILKNPEQIEFTLIQRDIHEIKDNAIIQTAVNLGKEGNKVTLVSKDINVRIKADTIGLDAEDYTKGSVNYDKLYKGWVRSAVPANDLRLMTPKNVYAAAGNQPLAANEFVILESQSNEQNYRLYRHMGNKTFKEVTPITLMSAFNAKNVQQLMALELLLDDSVKLLTLLGPAGTGKTFLTLLVGLYKTAYEHAYRKLMVTRPVIALGADIGFLPGDVQEKLHYWMQPVHDNLEFIASKMLRGTEQMLGMGSSEKKRKKAAAEHHQAHQERERQTHHENKFVEQLQRQGFLSLEAITYMRGRSIPYQFVFIDEVQNLSPHEVKTIVSRAGEGTKVILAGDPYQIDSPYLDFSSNGLTVTTEKFKEQSLFGSVFLEISERSELAKLAAEIL
ncbi:PhoH family protein [Candidatus Dependentiae bacterium]|nr:PhoH family protein [Candidatus Dependentiae bacterium]